MDAIYEISTLFWGALIFLALFVSCFLAWKAIEWLRYRRKFDGGAVEAVRMKQREQEELWAVDPILFTLSYVPGLERKATKERRRARQQAQKRSKGRN
jgi:hypothetical protein